MSSSKFLNVSTTSGNESEPNSVKILKFFNYHEFAELYYSDIVPTVDFKRHYEDKPIFVTHFLNVYEPEGSEEYLNTRIVRVPRRFEGKLDCPIFSNVLPGSEPAALVNDSDDLKFVPNGIFDDSYQLYGYTSMSPLSTYLTQEQFQKIVDGLNEVCEISFAISSTYNLLDLFLEVITLTTWRWIAEYVYPNPYNKIDQYVERINESPLFNEQRIKLIPPKKSGFLSLDFQIPKPRK